MPTDNKKLRVSKLQSGDPDGGDVNDECHHNQTNLQPNDRHIMPNPRVQVILWGKFYADHPDAENTVSELVTAIVSGRYMNGLAQYGIGRGTFEGVTLVDVDRSPAPPTLSSGEAQDQLIQWLETGTVFPAPAVNEHNRLYLIVPPTSTVLTPADEGFGGYHQHGQINSDSDSDDLFWAIFRTNNPPSTGDALIRRISFIISHEMTEAFTDRDGSGWLSSNGCEISDLCETFGSDSGNVTTFTYEGFQVERYWSNWNRGCIKGNDPVHLSRFLKAVAPGGIALPGAKWTGMPKIGLDTIAQRMRH